METEVETLAADNLLAARGKAVLLVEDNADVRNFVGRFLTYFGARMDCANNGIEGIEKALCNHYDLILMDIAMPVCDGIEATRRLRESGYEGSIIALTGLYPKPWLDRCRELGFDQFLLKPVNRIQLLQVLSSEPLYHRSQQNVSIH